MRRRIASRWRSVARQMVAIHGYNKLKIRAALKQEYGSIMTIIAIIQAVMFLIDLWRKLHPTGEIPDVATSEELEAIDWSDDDE